MHKARDEKAEATAAAANAAAAATTAAMNVKIDKMMAALLSQSSQVQCPADDFDADAEESVQLRGRTEKTSGAHNVI